MISLLKGNIFACDTKKNTVKKNTVIVDVAGVGYEVAMHKRDIARVTLNSEITLYTYLHVREECMDLYGFLQAHEKDCFVDLLSVSGIGPKLGMAILGEAQIPELIQAICTENKAFFRSLSGVGPKMAQRIILELQTKVKKWPTPSSLDDSGAHVPMPEMDDLRSTFLNLGYSGLQIERALMAFGRSETFMNQPFEEKVREMLKKLSLKPATDTL